MIIDHGGVLYAVNMYGVVRLDAWITVVYQVVGYYVTRECASCGIL